MDVLRIQGVYVGMPAVLTEFGGQPVISSIVKRPATEPELTLTDVNLAGDAQADLMVHGGPDKAVYVYPAEHYATWREAGYELEEGRVGENVSTLGATEETVRLGDVWQWGDALVQVSQPRSPCFRLGLHAKDKYVIRDMIASGRCGWYMRVLQQGTVPTSGELKLITRAEYSPTIAELYSISFSRRSDKLPGQLRRLIADPHLAAQWRAALVDRLADVEAPVSAP
jgi:MOSC domain-containing protein YiiM